MDTSVRIRTRVHHLVDQMDVPRLAALLRLMGEEYFSPREFKKILEHIEDAYTAASVERLKGERCYPWRQVKATIKGKQRKQKTDSPV